MKEPANSRVSSPPDIWWKLNLLADVAVAMSEYEKSEAHQIDEEEEARIFVTVPRKKRSRLSRRSSSMATQWTTRVNEKQRSVTCAEGYKEVEEEEERSLKKRKIARRFEVGSSSRSTELKEEERVLTQNPNPVPSTSSCSSSVVTECKKRRPINISKEEGESSVKKRRIVRRLGVDPTQQSTTIPEWLVNLMMREEINGSDPKLIVVRKLYKSDLDRVQARLSMPLNQVVSPDFLTEEETRIIYEQSVLKTRKEGISVALVDPLLNKHVVDLRKWNMNGNWTYVFVDGWNDVVSTNTFEIGDVYPVWSFRSGEGKLFFALVPSPTRNSSDSTHGDSSSGQSGLSSQ